MISVISAQSTARNAPAPVAIRTTPDLGEEHAGGERDQHRSDRTQAAGRVDHRFAAHPVGQARRRPGAEQDHDRDEGVGRGNPEAALVRAHEQRTLEVQDGELREHRDAGEDAQPREHHRDEAGVGEHVEAPGLARDGVPRAARAIPGLPSLVDPEQRADRRGELDDAEHDRGDREVAPAVAERDDQGAADDAQDRHDPDEGARAAATCDEGTRSGM